MAEGSENLIPIVSKIFCSSSLTTLVVRRRPHVINGGGFVVSDCEQKIAFSVDGCGVLGAKGQLVVKDSDGSPILFIHKKGGIIQAISTCTQWNGYIIDYEGAPERVFSLSNSKPFFGVIKTTKIYIEPKRKMNKDHHFEVIGSFPQRNCTIINAHGIVASQVGLKEMNGSKDLYSIVVQPGFDQAFVVGVIAILDYLNGESTSC